MSNSEVVVAIDLGGTNCRGAIVDSSGAILERTKLDVDTSKPDPSIVIDAVGEVIRGYQPAHMVVGVPGLVDYQNNLTVRTPNLPESWAAKLSSDYLSEHTGLTTFLANDADLAGVGEFSFGAGQECQDFAYVTISTGIGGAAVLRGELLRGRYSAFEIGHMVVNLASKQNRRTGEQLGAGPAMLEIAQEHGLEVKSTKELLDLVRTGDDTATMVFDGCMEGASALVLNVAQVVAPEVIVVGGGVGLNSDLVLPRIRKVLDAGHPMGKDIHLVTASLGDDAGLRGAAGWISVVASAKTSGVSSAAINQAAESANPTSEQAQRRR